VSARRRYLSQGCPRITVRPVCGCSSPKISQGKKLPPQMLCGVNGGIAEEVYRINYGMQRKKHFRTVYNLLWNIFRRLQECERFIVEPLLEGLFRYSKCFKLLNTLPVSV